MSLYLDCHWKALPVFRVGLPASDNLIKTTPHRCAPQLVFQQISDSAWSNGSEALGAIHQLLSYWHRLALVECSKQTCRMSLVPSESQVIKAFEKGPPPCCDRGASCVWCVQRLAEHCTGYHFQLSLKCLTAAAPPSRTLSYLLTKGARAMLHCGRASGFLLTACELRIVCMGWSHSCQNWEGARIIIPAVWWVKWSAEGLGAGSDKTKKQRIRGVAP